MNSSQTTPEVVFLDRGTLAPETVLRALPFAHRLTVFDATAPHEVAARIANAQIVITNKVKLPAEVLREAASLRLVAIAATGTDHVDLRACAARGICVSNVRNYAVHTVPEHTFALIFALRRSLHAYCDAVRAGRWQASGQFCFHDYPIHDLAGSTIGIVGGGTLGRAVGEIARLLGLKVLYAARKGQHSADTQHTPFADMLRLSDIITLHCPLTPANVALIGREEFAQMARRPLLINTARGGLVDEAALVDALRQGQVCGAGFDVATQEPPGPGHPFHALRDHPAFLLTPHVAWASREAIQALADQLIDNIAAFAAGSPRNVVAG
ncbi:D-2-hydroxyacid dehydrogenase [Cupriavidus basilensis]|uniref:D-2-hydroxyacid dehydrogenase n=1 Tax=Cupriavidus basilensis TaxID=68895 RepID=UPI00283C0306|nr:D-2-hydroxyacid dehydrogenase [Cupriavidus basilensis]MDR3379365.1 D-2-hydroxyacid dehydrogenase [Cupriavidus basilensis]